jgi:hypothetical protein
MKASGFIACIRDYECGRGLMSATFTFFGERDWIEVRIVEFETCSPANEGGAVWLDSTVTVQAGAFLGSFKASVTTDDLMSLREQLRQALTSLSGTVSFQNTGGGLSLSIKLDGSGRTSITGVAQPNRLRGGVLNFRVDTDHFALIRALRELEDTLREFSSKQARNQKLSWS